TASSPASQAPASATSSAPWYRVYGAASLDTMAKVSQEGWSTSDAVVIATFDGYKDALAASSLAGQYKCPILLSHKSQLPAQTKKEIKRLGAKTAFIVGGPIALSPSIEDQLKKTGITTVERVWGQTAADTATAIADHLGAKRSKTAIVVTDKSFKDALAIAPYAYKTGSPIYLTSKQGRVLIDNALRSIRDGSYDRVVVVGGPLAVSSSVVTQLRNAGISNISRLWAQNAEGTSSKVAEWCINQGMKPTRLGIATSLSYRDALTGSALCGKYNAPLLLIKDKNRSVVYSFINKQRSKVKHGYIFGGTKAVSSATEDIIRKGTTKTAYRNLDGVDLAGFTKLGIDVSEWQGYINWAEVKNSGIDFAIVRVAHSDSHTDLHFKTNLQQARAVGIELGVYIYSKTDTVEGARNEARKVKSLLSSVGFRPSDIPLGVYYDLEEAQFQNAESKGLLLQMTKAFSTEMKAGGYNKIGVYANLNWWTNYLTSNDYNQWSRWLARWVSRDKNISTADYFGSYKLWQFSSTGSVPGIAGNVDMDLGYW
ncbi:MAG: cell wall-binding repeat-containing protein, partial [Eggerthellaceae bacterium]|nr:cell wall-binding repeat-containing protein [Eggerthellaceae bacterium]